MNRGLDVFEFHWSHENVTQKKILIPHSVYLQFKVLPTDTKEEEAKKKKEFKEIIGSYEFFTDQSPLYEAMTTGIFKCNGIKMSCNKINSLIFFYGKNT